MHLGTNWDLAKPREIKKVMGRSKAKLMEIKKDSMKVMDYQKEKD